MMDLADLDYLKLNYVNLAFFDIELDDKILKGLSIW